LQKVARNHPDLAGMIIAIVPAMTRLGRILVVDDEANARTALAELLRDEGYEVETAADAFKALGKHESFAPHIVVTDLKMPGMDGIELVKKIRATDEVTGIIVMSAFGAVQPAIEAMRAGAAESLTKPLNFEELRVVVAKVLENQAIRYRLHQYHEAPRSDIDVVQQLVAGAESAGE
jgi:DNA-binding NtrC family response regulator